MNVFILNKQIIKTLKCGICLKNKAETISAIPLCENTPVCITCITWMQKEYNRGRDRPEKHYTVLTMEQVYEKLRKVR